MEISSSIILMQPGMYILRYPKGGVTPLSVSRAPNSTGKIEVMGTSKTHGSILRDGSDCIVMQVTGGAVELLVSAFSSNVAASVPTLRIDQIGLDPEPACAQPAAAGKKIEVVAKGISIIGHVELQGDLVAAEGQTLGDPSSTHRVEGFQIMWPDRPEGVDLAYSISVEGFGTMPVVNSGNFCGTRGEARRITEATFSLVGPNAGQFRLDGSAYFSGGFQVPISSGMPLGGPSGMEHLTAISLRALPALAKEIKVNNPWDESTKTKVFKSKAAASKTEPAKTTQPKKAAEPKKADIRAAKSK
jgi:hypothetical protein